MSLYLVGSGMIAEEWERQALRLVPSILLGSPIARAAAYQFAGASEAANRVREKPKEEFQARQAAFHSVQAV